MCEFEVMHCQGMKNKSKFLKDLFLQRNCWDCLLVTETVQRLVPSRYFFPHFSVL